MKFNHKSFSIGVEIEMTGLSRLSAANLVAEFFGNTVEYVGGSTDIYEICDDNNRIWRIESDESILPQKRSKTGVIIKATDEYKVELVSPILYYSDLQLLQEIIHFLNMYGNAFVNNSTGVHVHIGAHMFTPEKLMILCNIVFSKQHLLEKALQYSHRRSYCDLLPKVLIEKLNQLKPKTIIELADIWYSVSNPMDHTRGNHYHHSRYRLLNIHQLLSGRQKTIEFRMFNGTLEEDILVAYIQFATLIAAQALSQVRASIKETVPVTGNDKYAFRIWLIKLGAIGEEYKTMRLHLLKHLNGNSAWRDNTLY